MLFQMMTKRSEYVLHELYRKETKRKIDKDISANQVSQEIEIGDMKGSYLYTYAYGV